MGKESMMDNILNNIPRIPAIGPPQGEKWSWWRLALLVMAFLVVSAGIVYLLAYIEGYLQRPLEGFAIYAYIIVFFVTLLSSATVILPAPGLVVVLAAASKWNPVWVAMAAGTGSTLGEITSYAVGYWGSRRLPITRSRLYHRAERFMRRYGILAVALVAFVPFTGFDFVGIAAGVFRIPWWQFLLGVLLGRMPRSFIETHLGGGLFRLLF